MATAYRMEFSTEEGTPVSCLIWDTTTYSEPEPHGYIDITGTGAPLILSVVDNDEDKFTPIKALQLEINFLSNNNVNINNFREGDDNRWYVEVFYSDSSTHIFKGFLVLDDLHEQFLCHPNEVSLYATDGLGLLKDIPLTAFDGTNPKGVFALATFVAFALEKTGLELDFNVMFNLRNESGEHAFTHTFLDAKTFEKEIGVSVSCYEALQIILGESCYLTQAFGEWWIIRVPEHMNTDNTVFKFDRYSVALSSETQSRIYFLNGDNPAYFSNESAVLNFIRPNKIIKETFAYEYPKEIVDNIDFSRGALLYTGLTADDADFIGVEQGPGSGFDPTEWGVNGFALDDWITGRDPQVDGVAANIDIFVRRVYHNGIEHNRYLQFQSNGTAVGNNFTYARCNAIPMSVYDKFNFSVDRKLNNDFTGGGTTTDFVAAIKLVGDNGTTYWLKEDGVWTTTFTRVAMQWKRDEEDERVWKTVSVDAKPVPASGNLFIYLLLSDIFPEYDTRFQNLRFDYQPFINGSFRTFDGQYHKIEQPGNYKAVRESDVIISDAPRRLLKGALLYPSGVDYKLTAKWYDHDENAIPLADQYHSFGWWQAYGVWNQYSRLFRSFEFTAQGLISNTNFPAMIHRFLLADDTAHTRYKVFMLLHYEIDIKLCEWSGVMVEVKDVNINKDYSTPVEFRYTESR